MTTSPSSHGPEQDPSRDYYINALSVMDEVLADRTRILGELTVSEAEHLVNEENNLEESERAQNVVWAPLPPDRPGTLDVHDLEPFMDIVVRDERDKENGGVIDHFTLLSEPYLRLVESGNEVLCVDAQRIVVDEEGAAGFDFNEKVRTVNLAAWGVAATPDGLYNQVRYIEPFIEA